jgi:hypothetical protein
MLAGGNQRFVLHVAARFHPKRVFLFGSMPLATDTGLRCDALVVMPHEGHLAEQGQRYAKACATVFHGSDCEPPLSHNKEKTK